MRDPSSDAADDSDGEPGLRKLYASLVQDSPKYVLLPDLLVFFFIRGERAADPVPTTQRSNKLSL